ncbi:MAG: hypothetical protein GY834_03620 [Bacteroidetes bacterium]|nr:hypothetical protein [Bacteroidota bacterium]
MTSDIKVIYEGLSGKLLTTLLKPGRRSKSLNVFSLVKKLISYLAEYWPDTLIILRGDGHFCSKGFIDYSEGKSTIGFLTGFAGNAVLNRLSKIIVESAKREYDQDKKPVKRYHSFEYRAGSWEHS